MVFWPNSVSSENLLRLGPYIDGFIGTDGEYTDLVAAIAAGWKRILIGPGATLGTGDVVLAADDGFIVGFGKSWSAVLTGTGKINIQGKRWRLAGFRLDGQTGDGIALSLGSQQNIIENVAVNNAGGIGLHDGTTSGVGKTQVIGCQFLGAASDGVRIKATASGGLKIIGCEITANGGWGINDLAANSFAVACDLSGNTSGAETGIPSAQKAANQLT